MERKKLTLQTCLRMARDAVLGLGLTSNRSSVVSDRLAKSTGFQNVRKRLCAGFTTHVHQGVQPWLLQQPLARAIDASASRSFRGCKPPAQVGAVFKYVNVFIYNDMDK